MNPEPFCLALQEPKSLPSCEKIHAAILRWTGRAVLAVLILGFWVGSAEADCMSACQSRYYSCVQGFNARDCATSRSICQNKCIMSGVRQYGAFAYSPKTESYGFSRGQRTRKRAEAVAMKHCASGAKSEADCQILTWFYDACGGLATSKDGAYGADWGRTGRIASRKAVAVCRKHSGKNCEIKKVVCSKR